MKGKRLSQGGVVVLVLLLAVMVVTMTTSPSTAQTQKPQYGGVLKAIAQGGPTVLGYPSKMRPSFHGGQVFACVESLFKMDGEGRATPYLAESWEWSKDGTSVAIKLRKGVKFHDGTEFNAKAAKWNLEQAVANRKPAVRSLTTIGVLDEHTIGLVIRRFDNTFLGGLAGGDGMMVSPTAVEKNGVEWAMLNPVGTGPFKLVEFKRDVTFKLTKFDQYWQKGKPYLDGVEFIYITDPTVASASFLAGNANIFMTGILGKEVADLKKKGYKVLSIYTGGGQFLAPDSANPNSPFAKKKVREAIAYAVDTTPIAETLGHGYWVVLNGQLAGPGSMGHVPDFKGRPYNPEKAKQLLKEAGYPKGFKTKIVPWPTPDPHVAIQAQLAKVGIKAELDVPDKGKLESIWFGGWKNALVWRGTGGSTNYTSQLPPLFGAGTPWLPSMRRPDGLAELVDKATMARDYDTQVKLTQQCMRMLAEDATLLPLWGIRFSYVVDDKIHDTGLAETHNIMWTPENAWLSK